MSTRRRPVARAVAVLVLSCSLLLRCGRKLPYIDGLCFTNPRVLLGSTTRPHALRGAPRPMRESSDTTKAELLAAIENFKKVEARDGQEAVDFGVKGGELDGDSRAPRNLAANGAFYKVSDDLGRAADAVFCIIDRMSKFESLAHVATRDLGTPEGENCPLHGEWRLLFTTAADASFSKNSTRGDAKASNIVDGVAGTVTNVIEFIPGDDGAPPVLEELRVQIALSSLSASQVGLQFKYVKARVTKFFGIPLGGRRLTLTLPVPGPFLTRIICFFTRKTPPKAFFEVLYLDSRLRIHRTGEGNLFVQRRPPAVKELPTFLGNLFVQ